MVVNSCNNSVVTITTKNDFNKEINKKLKGALYLTGIAGMFFLSGFGSVLLTIKKKSPKLFIKSSINAKYNNTGIELAVRALKWGTFYSITSCGILFYSIWKISEMIPFEEFHEKLKCISLLSKKKT